MDTSSFIATLTTVGTGVAWQGYHHRFPRHVIKLHYNHHFARLHRPPPVASVGCLRFSIALVDGPHAFGYKAAATADCVLDAECFHVSVAKQVVETFPMEFIQACALISVGFG